MRAITTPSDHAFSQCCQLHLGFVCFSSHAYTATGLSRHQLVLQAITRARLPLLQPKMSSRLESLPTELLHHICDTVEASESYEGQHQEFFVNLSLTSKRCRSVATRFIFNQLIFRTVHLEVLLTKLADCARTLAVSGCIEDVQSFHITVGGPGYVCYPIRVRYGAQDGTRVAECLKMFPNISGVFMQLGQSSASPDAFIHEVTLPLGDGDVGSEYTAGHYFCWWYKK